MAAACQFANSRTAIVDFIEEHLPESVRLADKYTQYIDDQRNKA